MSTLNITGLANALLRDCRQLTKTQFRALGNELKTSPQTISDQLKRSRLAPADMEMPFVKRKLTSDGEVIHVQTGMISRDYRWKKGLFGGHVEQRMDFFS